MKRQRPLNWKIVRSNLAEAREQLEALEKMSDDPRRSEISLLLGLEHAYHHLNFAWHIRRLPTSRYAHLTDQDFDRWGAFPTDAELPSLRTKQRKKWSKRR